MLWSITAFIIFKSRWFETVDRFGQSELLPGSNFSYVPFYLFTGEVLYCLIVNTFFKRLPLCGYQLPFIRIYYYRLNFIRNSHVVLSHIQRSQSQRWINATFITQSLSSNCTIQESWGGIQWWSWLIKETTKGHQSLWGLENTLPNLGVTGRSPTVCLHSKSSETPFQHQVSLSQLQDSVCAPRQPATFYRHTRIHRQSNYLTYNSYHSNN